MILILNTKRQGIGFLIVSNHNLNCTGVTAMANKSIPKKQRICQVKECGRKYYSLGYCFRHYAQFKKNGYVFGNPSRLGRFEPNKFVIENGLCKIELYDKYGYVSNYAVIDSEDYYKVKNLRLSIDGRRSSVYCNSVKKKLHQIILKKRKGYNIDHIDGDILNNRKSNLRYCSQAQNSRNSAIPKNNISGYKGVMRRKNRWCSRIKYNYKGIHLGMYDSKIEAAKAYNKAAIKYFGEFARLNII